MKKKSTRPPPTKKNKKTERNSRVEVRNAKNTSNEKTIDDATSGSSYLASS